MDNVFREVLEFINENEVKFVRLYFCDLLGAKKSVSIMPGELERAFTSGISFDGSNIKGFSEVSQSDLFLIPDPSSLNTLPWRPHQKLAARFFCGIVNPDGSPFIYDTRNILKNAVKRCEAMGYICKIGVESEFYLFKTDENGEPTLVPHDNGGYFDAAPLDKGENIRREICLALEEIGIMPETSHHESGPGQHEIDFKYSDALSAADNFITFKSTVKAVADRNGLFASFLPKPFPDKSGSGLHVNISLHKNGTNIFNNAVAGTLSREAESFIAGIIDKTAEMTAFLNPISNSYERFGAFEAPKYVSWSHQNRSQLVRIPAASGEYARMELRSPDSSLNPYLSFALIIHAGLDGIERGMNIPKPMDVNLYAAGDDTLRGLETLPDSLASALEITNQSGFIAEKLGDALFNKYMDIKNAEALDNDRGDAYFNAV